MTENHNNNKIKEKILAEGPTQYRTAYVWPIQQNTDTTYTVYEHSNHEHEHEHEHHEHEHDCFTIIIIIMNVIVPCLHQLRPTVHYNVYNCRNR